MQKSLYALVILVLLTPVLAAPAPWGIAINNETDQCAGYWGGDEFKYYELPEGWSAYYPNYTTCVNGSCELTTPLGSCDFSRGDEGKCCEELGLQFVSQNIGKVETTDLGMQSLIGSYAGLILIPLLFLIFVVLIVLKIKTRSFLPFTSSYPLKGLCLGLILGLLSTLSLYVLMGVTSASSFYNTFGFESMLLLAFLVFISPAAQIFENFGYGLFENWDVLSSSAAVLIINLAVLGLIGWVIGLIIKKLKKR